MNTKQYEEYKAAVERNLKGLTHVSTGACPGCDECGLGEEDCDDNHKRDLAEEPHFSWSSCDSCGSTLGGDRHPAHGWMKLNGKDHLLHMDVCVDCLYYLNYGRLDDMSMLEMEKPEISGNLVDSVK